MNDQITFAQVHQELSENEYLVEDKKAKLVVVFDRGALSRHGEQRIKRIYRIEEGDKLCLVDLKEITHEIVDLIANKIKLKELASEVVKTTPADELLEVFRRIQQPKLKEKAKAEKGCYEIVVPGNKGQQPIELFLRRSS